VFALPENVFEFASPKVSSTVMVITPDMARRWLTRNVSNRKLKPLAIAKYARDMASGRWELTGEGIKFGADGNLKDGQNRLHACIKVNTPFITFVIRGVSDEAQRVMDTGVGRTAADSLTIAGEGHATAIASAAKLALSIAADAGDYDHFSPTHAEVEAFVNANPDIRTAAEFSTRVARKTDCPPSVVTYTTWVLSQINRDAAYDFWISAAEKVGLNAGDPVIAMTNRFAESRRNRERVPKRAYLSAIYRAWNARRRGQTLRIIKINSAAGGLVPIPEPK
jgi:hypothetical protein